MYKILLVEDDNTIGEAVRRHLIKWGHQVEIVTDFNDVLGHFSRCSPHLVLMDIGLPFYNGYHWCQEIRRLSNVPVIFISSASDNMNIVMAMNMGGDDFIIKPFDLEVLAAKVQAILRRSYSLQGQSALIEYGGVILNASDMTVSCREQKLALSKNEFKILKTLFEKAPATVSRDDMMRKLWDDECFVDDNTLTVNVNRLRKRLETLGLTHFIITKKGVGYQLHSDTRG